MTRSTGFTQGDRRRMERAHVRAWPALQTVQIDGWLWRSSGGGSQRANSVSTVNFTGNDPDAAITQVERLYEEAGHAPRLQTFDDSCPVGLPNLLTRRGYRQMEITTTMFKRPETAADVPPVDTRNEAWDEWLDVYLSEITENRRQVNAEILRKIPSPKAFFGARREGHVVATGLAAISFGCAVVECVATRESYRRQGAARALLRALEQWALVNGADLLGLQVVETNAPAIALYASLGYVGGATNTFWMKPAG